MGGEKFNPAATLTPEQVQKLWARGNVSTATAPPRVFDPDLNDGSVTNSAVHKP
jgi:hypothetical protein